MYTYSESIKNARLIKEFKLTKSTGKKIVHKKVRKGGRRSVHVAHAFARWETLTSVAVDSGVIRPAQLQPNTIIRSLRRCIDIAREKLKLSLVLQDAGPTPSCPHRDNLDAPHKEPIACGASYSIVIRKKESGGEMQRRGRENTVTGKAIRRYLEDTPTGHLTDAGGPNVHGEKGKDEWLILRR